jgi:acyl carrier protein
MKTIQEDELSRQIREWIKQSHNHNGAMPGAVMDDTDLIGSGILDSLGFIDLMVYLETVTEEKIDLNDVDPAEFTTIRGLCKSVMTQRNQTTRG